MKLYADLHVHTCLSPCGDDDMTPNDIIAMAMLKGLDAIAITDHNSCLNLHAIEEVAKGKDIIVIPGLEVTTQEEIHVLCYFYTFEDAYRFSEEIFRHLAPFYNKNEIFGKQIQMNNKDEEIGCVDRLLITVTDLDICAVADLCRNYGGVPVPAHINKEANSVLMSLGVIPPECGFKTVEVHRPSKPPKIDLSPYKIIYSSDAHCLPNIFEREFAIEVEEWSIKGILSSLL